MNDDGIRLGLPARPEYGRIARIAAAQLGLRIGLAMDTIDDLRLAIDEAIVSLVGPRRRVGRLDIVFHVTEDALITHLALRLDRRAQIPERRVVHFEEMVAGLDLWTEIDGRTGLIRVSAPR